MKTILMWLFPQTCAEIAADVQDVMDSRTFVKINVNGRTLIHVSVLGWKQMSIMKGDDEKRTVCEFSSQSAILDSP